MAVYSDWQLQTTSAGIMSNVVNSLGFTQGDGFLDTSQGRARYTINVYGQKFLPSATQTFKDPYGNIRPVMVAQPGYFAILRWYSSIPFPPPGMNIPGNVTIVPLPADSPVVFAPA